MKTIALIAKAGKAEAVQLAREIRARFPDRQVMAERHLAAALDWDSHSDRDLAQAAELVVVMGGDGTLIRASRLLEGRAVPILGVNLGSLGFLTELPQEEAITALTAVLENRCSIDARMKLSCRLHRGDQVLVDEEVLNDVVINKGALARIADHETYVDGEYVATYKSDGVIVSTPTGSTAYSLSAGGPIVHPSLEGVVVTPICSHALTHRAIVVPSDRVISIVLKTEAAEVYLTLDGQSGHSMRMGDRVEVRRANNPVLLVRNPDLAYFSLLRKKLHWGER